MNAEELRKKVIARDAEMEGIERVISEISYLREKLLDLEDTFTSDWGKSYIKSQENIYNSILEMVTELKEMTISLPIE